MLSMGACTAVFDEEGHILLVRKAYGARTWTLPGGGLDGDESPMAAAERETLEEAGLHVTVERLIGIYYRPTKGRLVFFFEASPRGGALLTEPDREIETRAYFLPSRVPSEMSPSARLRVHDATLRQERAFIRVISG
jgi:ADP-ribose pyrophosphatase YjhB (NUDIX family)